MVKYKNLIITCALLLVTITITVITGITYSKFKNYEVEFRFEEGTTTFVEDSINYQETRTIEKFSKYSKSLKGTIGDSNIYKIASENEGPSILVIGGTHPNEPAGQIAATVILENVHVKRGTVYVITECNKSAYGYSYPLEASPMYYNIETAHGTRLFKFGSRATNNTEQWPNPDVYIHDQSGQKLSASETRNLNRSYPGRENGTYSERVAYAVTQCIIENDIAITVDLHEASPEYVTINAIIYHERGESIASSLVLDFEFIDNDISPNVSAANLHGLTHRELGDYTDTLAFIMETSNASQGKIRGAFTTDIILDGREDKYYTRIQALDESGKTDILYADVTSLDERVARHVYGVKRIISAFNSLKGQLKKRNGDNYASYGDLLVSGLPDYDDVIDNKLGYYL